MKKGVRSMPNRKAAFEALRQNKRKRIVNTRVQSELKTVVKDFEALLATKNIEKAKQSLASVISTIDKAVTKGILHRSTASRKISRLSKRLAHLKA